MNDQLWLLVIELDGCRWQTTDTADNCMSWLGRILQRRPFTPATYLIIRNFQKVTP